MSPARSDIPDRQPGDQQPGAPAPAEDGSAAGPYLPEPMLSYRCNLAGCCCAAWRIHFTDRDLARLAEHLPEDELPGALRDGLICVVDTSANVLEHFMLGLRGKDQTCRFLGEAGSCTIQQRFGIEALPDICVDFPVVAWRLGGRIELGFTTLCPAVLDALLAEPAPLQIVQMPAPDAMFRRRLERVSEVRHLTLGGVELGFAELLSLRKQILDGLQDMQRPPLEHLQAVSYGFAFLINTGDPQAFELRYDMPALPFVRYLHHALQSHASSWLAQLFERYRRFVFDPALLAAVGSEQELEQALEDWQEPLLRLVEPAQVELGPYINRFLAMRYFSCLARVEGDVVVMLGRVAHVLATALRYAAAFCALQGSTLDLRTLKVALGAASFAHHNDYLLPQTMVWFVPEHFQSEEPPPPQVSKEVNNS